ncbi:hypothetical protein BWZ20_06385 [Winogradskyella sp. J14-2]|uniref:nucleotidyltransferase family protein n=1 Tax=Winogradskyella sp. J14-2 TaxID=1936080 RepID=UPI000972D9F5|nr:nucleotidyltransferase family protein [Winogradskyella sp. J14-2]APY07953.1 hypothetical protein BWZ20_06385 [Winogradskyella sp. J14-2]
MGNLANTYQYIADILSFRSSKDELEKVLGNKDFNWDNIVIEGSKHLVLPTIYCRLKSKQLTYVLPKELDSYLEEITSLNRNRNTQIISQVHALTELLKAHNIEHVFLKGAALISCCYYGDIAERMLGDIDILVNEDHLDLAFNILKNNSYYPIEQTLGNDFFEHKHLPRLKTDKYICAVELHKKLFVTYKNEELQSPKVLSSKTIVNGIFVPSPKHLLLHNILNYQINDKGNLYNSINFRSAYDCIVLYNKANIDLPKNSKTIRKYYNLLGLFFSDIPNKHKNTNSTTSFYFYKLNHIGFYKVWNKLLKLLDFSWTVMSRVPYLIGNKAYRMALFKDRKRILTYISSVLKRT